MRVVSTALFLTMGAAVIAGPIRDATQITGCAFAKANEKQIGEDAARAAICVATSLLAGATGAAAIVGACAFSTIEMVIEEAASLIAFYETPHDGGVRASPLLVPPELVDWKPPPALVERWKMVLVDAQAMKAAR